MRCRTVCTRITERRARIPSPAARCRPPMTVFPPIAEYAFLSDCEVSTLIAPDGSVEWLCLPRPDAPSVFGALLDRAGGVFELRPTHALVPDQRRYAPGTNVLETTWHTESGWLTVQDALVMTPVENAVRRDSYRRVPDDAIAHGVLLRVATCFSGRVELETNCLPLFDYGRVPAHWEYDGPGYDGMTTSVGDLTLELR